MDMAEFVCSECNTVNQFDVSDHDLHGSNLLIVQMHCGQCHAEVAVDLSMLDPFAVFGDDTADPSTSWLDTPVKRKATQLLHRIPPLQSWKHRKEKHIPSLTCQLRELKPEHVKQKQANAIRIMIDQTRGRREIPMQIRSTELIIDVPDIEQANTLSASITRKPIQTKELRDLTMWCHSIALYMTGKRGYPPSIFIASCNMFDRVLSATLEETIHPTENTLERLKRDYLLLLCGCITLSVKQIEVVQERFENIERILKRMNVEQTISTSELADIEHRVVKILLFDLTVPSTLDIGERILNFAKPEQYQKLHRRMRHVVEMAQIHYDLLVAEDIVIVLAALIYSCDHAKQDFSYLDFIPDFILEAYENNARDWLVQYQSFEFTVSEYLRRKNRSTPFCIEVDKSFYDGQHPTIPGDENQMREALLHLLQNGNIRGERTYPNPRWQFNQNTSQWQ